MILQQSATRFTGGGVNQWHIHTITMAKLLSCNIALSLTESSKWKKQQVENLNFWLEKHDLVAASGVYDY